MSTGRLRDRDKRHDPYYERAKRDGFAARSVYKLQEIDERHRLLAPGRRVLDLGCWPGSWLQYARGRVGPRGVLVGVDRFPVTGDAALGLCAPPPFRQLVGDVFALEQRAVLGDLPAFDVVLSDMAPDTTGVRVTDQARSEALFLRALELAEALLAPGGHFCAKLFQGPAWNDLLRRCRKGFCKVYLIKPAGTRKESLEQYVVGLGRS